MIRKATARWEGTLKEGKGRLKLGSGAFEGPYSFRSRFEDGSEANPEELLGAAHAGCFTMALSMLLGNAGHPPTSLETTADVHLGKVADKFTITAIDLITTGNVPGITEEEFHKHAQAAKRDCIVSRALTPLITLKATLT